MPYPRLYAANAAVNTYGFETLGIGTLSDVISCVVTEERNGEYELEMEYPVGGIHYSDIMVDRLVMCKANESGSQQIFRIYKIEKPIDGKTTIYAEHISYLLTKAVVMPFAATTASAAFTSIQNNVIWQSNNINFKTFPFIFETDNISAGTCVTETPMTVRSMLGGVEGSILDAFGGEYEFDNFKVILHNARGTDGNVYLRYGKNITDLTNTDDISDVYTGIVPYWKGSLRKSVTNSDGNKTTESYDSIVYLTDKVLWSNHTSNYAYPLAAVVDFSSEIDSDCADIIETDSDGNETTTYYTTETDIRKQLTTLANEYLINNKGWESSENIEVSFINLWDTPEYANFAALQRVQLCDTVHVVYPKLGIEATTKVIKTKFNVLKDRYDSIELGETKSSLTSSVVKSSSEIQGRLDATTDSINQELNTAKTALTQEISSAKSYATDMINGKLDNLCGVGNGYFYFQRDASGKIYQLDIAKDESRSGYLIRMNQSGIGFSKNGGQSYDVAITIDGHINASYIDTGSLRAGIIKTGILKDASGNTTWDLDKGTLTSKKLAILSTNFNLTSDGTLTAKNGTFSGKIASSSGTIGGFTINSKSLYNNKTGLGVSTGDGVYIGTDGISIGNNSEWDGSPTLQVGHATDFNYVGVAMLTFYRKGGKTCGSFSWKEEKGKDWVGWNSNMYISDYLSCMDIDIRANSDERLKEDIEPLPVDESKRLILNVAPRRYRFKKRPETLRHGLIAQDVLQYTSDDALVHEDQESGMYGLNYFDVIADLINVVQDQERRIKVLEEALNAVNNS